MYFSVHTYSFLCTPHVDNIVYSYAVSNGTYELFRVLCCLLRGTIFWSHDWIENRSSLWGRQLHFQSVLDFKSTLRVEYKVCTWDDIVNDTDHATQSSLKSENHIHIKCFKLSTLPLMKQWRKWFSTNKNYFIFFNCTQDLQGTCGHKLYWRVNNLSDTTLPDFHYLTVHS